MPIPENRRRDERTYWMNDAPVTDIHEALDLLTEPWDASGPRFLDVGYDLADGAKPEIHFEWSRERNGQWSNGTNYLQIDSLLVEQLKNRGFVKPMEIPHMGYTETEKRKLIITDVGKKYAKLSLESKQSKAVELVRPPPYDALTPLYDPTRIFSFRESEFWGGKLYFRFEMLNGEMLKVYPDTGEFGVIPAEKKEAATGA
jgi:hypothetical protein